MHMQSCAHTNTHVLPDSLGLHDYMMKEGRRERERERERESKSPLKEKERIPIHEDCLEMRPARRRDGSR